MQPIQETHSGKTSWGEHSPTAYCGEPTCNRGLGGISPAKQMHGGPLVYPGESCQGQYGGFNPGQFRGGGDTPGHFQGGSHGQHDWCLGWNNQCYPKFKELLNVYLELTHGQLHLANVLNAVGKWLTNLPSLPKYTHLNGQKFLCWACVLSRCTFCECRYLKEGGHSDPSNITDKFADSAVDVLSKGVISRVNQLQNGGSPQTKKQKMDSGTSA